MKTFVLDKNIYNLNDEEILSFSAAEIFLEQGKNLYLIHELYNAFYINILKRIEYFGIRDVLEFLNKSNLYKNSEENIIKRWSNFDEIEIFSSLEKLEIINELSYNLILSFYNFKKNSSLDKDINTEEIFSFFNLLKNELLLQEYTLAKKNIQEQKRRDSNTEEKNRRECDKDEKNIRKEDSIDGDKDKILSSTANKLLILEQNSIQEEKEQLTQIYI